MNGGPSATSMTSRLEHIVSFNFCQQVYLFYANNKVLLAAGEWGQACRTGGRRS